MCLSRVKGDMTQKMLFLCNALIILMSDSHRESVQRASFSQLQQLQCADKRLDLDMHKIGVTVGVTSDLRNDSRESEHRDAKCFNKRDICTVKLSYL